jgi:hypothetical protein
LKDEYGRMQPHQKSAVNLLSEKHHSSLVLPFLLSSGKITASEYAKGCIALASKVERDNNKGFYHELYLDAVTAKEYLSLHEDPAGKEQPLVKLIRNGESASLEFKSTLRWDLKTGKPAGYIERACLKTICAFLNTTGGILLIGIRDDGSVEGIESDRFVNEDKFLLHLWTLIRTSLGRDVSPFITSRLEKNGEKTICLLTCSRSPRPVFLRQPGFDEEFYIRMGPGSTALEISEALKYIGDRF